MVRALIAPAQCGIQGVQLREERDFVEFQAHDLANTKYVKGRPRCPQIFTGRRLSQCTAACFGTLRCQHPTRDAGQQNFCRVCLQQAGPAGLAAPTFMTALRRGRQSYITKLLNFTDVVTLVAKAALSHTCLQRASLHPEDIDRKGGSRSSRLSLRCSSTPGS